jgi:hypothetical protein
MRTDRLRLNESTQWLLRVEKRLLELDRQVPANHGDLDSLLHEIYQRIESSPSVRTGREVDELLQFSMLYLAARLHFHFRTAAKTRFKISTSVYNCEHNLFVMKPSYYFPGRCTIRHPTIFLNQPAAAGSTDDATQPYGYDVGLSGLALASGKVLHCTSIQAAPGRDSCPYHIPLDLRSESALSVPLAMDLAEALGHFARAGAARDGRTTHCCQCPGTVHTFPRREHHGPTYGVLNIDCDTTELQLAKAQEILADAEVRHVLELMTARLSGYLADRAAYSVLRNCTALFQLSQHTLEARQAYVALLGEVSAMCDGADVTLHLRDMFDPGDESRSVKLVAGFGPRFQGFLIGERYGDGLVGDAMRDGQFKSLDNDEIKTSLGGNPQYSYRLLIPGTVLNAVAPIHFHTRVIGAINIEWDKRHFAAAGPAATNLYLAARQAAIERVAQYFALVIDYFDDRDNQRLKPPAELAGQPAYVRRSTSCQRILAYYVESALDQIDQAAEPDRRRDPHAWCPFLEPSLRDLIDAAGYFLTFENKHRILASVRYRTGDGADGNLDLVCAHGFNRKILADVARDPTPGGPIPIEAGESVLGTCAVLGIAIFGRIEDNAFLVPDPLCLECAPVADREFLRRPIKYKPAGPQPVYEVGVPLVFGGKVLGTFDFELFSFTRPHPQRSNGEGAQTPAPALAGHELEPFLKWARAITFCIAYAEDAGDVHLAKGRLEAPHLAAFRRCQRLCAQIVANVPIPHELLVPIASEYLRGLIPLGKLELKRGGAAEATTDHGSDPLTSTRELWWRGDRRGTVTMTLGAETTPPYSVFPERCLTTGTSLLAQRFIAAFYTAALVPERNSEFDARVFTGVLDLVRASFVEQVDAMLAADQGRRSPHALIDTLFKTLHEALLRHLPEGSRGETTRQANPHGWFLYLAQHDGKDTVLRCGQPFARWVAMSTEEMRYLVSRVLGNPDREQVFAEILGLEEAQTLLGAWRAQCHTASYNVEYIEEIFKEALALRGRPYDPEQDHGPSITAETVRRKKVVSVIDLNRSPVRSQRVREWFFGDAAYSIVSAPISLADRVIGVLQIFRRREAIDDLRFFKNAEIDAVASLAKAVEDAAAEQVRCLHVPVLRSIDATRSFTPQIEALGKRVKERLSRRQVRLLVSCDFLAEESLLTAFLEHYIGPCQERMSTDELAGHETIRIEKMTHKEGEVVCILHTSRGRLTKSMRERLAALTGPGGPAALILFVARADEQAAIDVLPEPAFVRQEQDADEDLLRVAFGVAEGQENLERESIGILLRPAGPYSLSRLAEQCGTEEGAVRNRAKIVLENMKDRSFVSERLFDNWYQVVEMTPAGAPGPPPARHARGRRA